LNKNPQRIKINPVISPIEISLVKLHVHNHILILFKLVDPKDTYTIEIPNSIKPDAKEPSIKYFSPASIETLEHFFIEAKMYKVKLCNSKYVTNISLDETNRNIPSIHNSIRTGSSKFIKFSVLK
jgi:hypothetical protein